MGFIGRFIVKQVINTAVLSGSASQSLDKLSNMFENIGGLSTQDDMIKNGGFQNYVLVTQAPRWNRSGIVWNSTDGVSHNAIDLQGHIRYKVLSDGSFSNKISYTISDARGSSIAVMKRRYKSRHNFTEHDVTECEAIVKDSEILSVRTFQENRHQPGQSAGQWHVSIDAHDYEVHNDDNQTRFDIFIPHKRLFQKDQLVARVTRAKATSADGYKRKCVVGFNDFHHELFSVLLAVALIET